jgi:hypothetical protein
MRGAKEGTETRSRKETKGSMENGRMNARSGGRRKQDGSASSATGEKDSRKEQEARSTVKCSLVILVGILVIVVFVRRAGLARGRGRLVDETETAHVEASLEENAKTNMARVRRSSQGIHGEINAIRDHTMA